MRTFHVKRTALAAVLLLFSTWTAAATEVRIARDGIELPARLYLPSGTGPFPAIVLMHGYRYPAHEARAVPRERVPALLEFHERNFRDVA